jgi:hypothetical protein
VTERIDCLSGECEPGVAAMINQDARAGGSLASTRFSIGADGQCQRSYTFAGGVVPFVLSPFRGSHMASLVSGADVFGFSGRTNTSGVITDEYTSLDGAATVSLYPAGWSAPTAGAGVTIPVRMTEAGMVSAQPRCSCEALGNRR